MSREQTIIQAAIPLLGDPGGVTMARIAEAAGIDEAEVRTVFPDVDAVVRACSAAMTASITAATDPAAEVQKIRAIGTGEPLPHRLKSLLNILTAYYTRSRDDVIALLQAGGPSSQAGDRTPRRSDFVALGRTPEIHRAVETLFTPADGLRLPPAGLAAAFLTLARLADPVANEEHDPLPPDDLIDLFLHGAVLP
ncbi:hypothetical protein [Actinoplanes sp. NPDC023714]|uniref:hypothetical protein n=1 Tax=Actinoplanes sp. NPDC023714 TaxID=3154322 RepID=UPI0033FE955D